MEYQIEIYIILLKYYYKKTLYQKCLPFAKKNSVKLKGLIYSGNKVSMLYISL